MKPLFPTAVLAIAAATFGLSVAVAQTPAPAKPGWSWPEQMKNRQVLPAGFGGERLSKVMKGFTSALGVRCTHCHVGEEGQPLSTYDFASDKKANKAIARDMLRLVHRLNTKELPAIAGLTEPQISCYTCHRGAKEPARTPPPKA